MKRRLDPSVYCPVGGRVSDEHRLINIALTRGNSTFRAEAGSRWRFIMHASAHGQSAVVHNEIIGVFAIVSAQPFAFADGPQVSHRAIAVERPEPR